MDTKYSEAEMEALEKKLYNPKETVICPRCGGVILYASVGNCSKARCSNGCIEGSIRGL